MCYEKCSKIGTGMVNCGPGGCSRDSETCVDELSEMTTDFISGITDLVTFVFSFGASGSVNLFKEVLTASMENVAT